jgi:hypothetical protein
MGALVRFEWDVVDVVLCGWYGFDRFNLKKRIWKKKNI